MYSIHTDSLSVSPTRCLPYLKVLIETLTPAALFIDTCVWRRSITLHDVHRTTQSQPIAPPTVTAVNADCCWRGLATAFICFNCLNGAPLPRASALPLLSQNPKRTLEKLRRRGESEHLLFLYYSFVQTDYCLM